ncbi:hypothetical protein [Shewanella surugensis]|uniref:ASP external chaperone domain-containing protein n=1 Tax=Shewanella surugensis TaxID=212020 RepID=A0ABT0LH66_9GAMM|nr:hypothetical protein [Shewanella surugensis]MCL1127038.1 hypothetical protein [Shewanella surugensis]
MRKALLLTVIVSLPLSYTVSLPAQEPSNHTMTLLNEARIQAKQLSSQKQYHLTIEKSDFGAYKVEYQLALVPQGIASVDDRVASLGTMSVMKSERPIHRVIKGTLARNVLTNKLAPISGYITVLLAKDVSVDDVTQTTGLEVVTSYAGTQLAVLKVADDADILLAAKKVKDSGLVVQTKIEVLDVVYEAY